MTKDVFCSLRPMVGEPPMIYGFLDRERNTPDMVYCLNEQGYIVRSAPQRSLTMSEMSALDEEAERCAKGYREENKLNLVVT